MSTKRVPEPTIAVVKVVLAGAEAVRVAARVVLVVAKAASVVAGVVQGPAGADSAAAEVARDAGDNIKIPARHQTFFHISFIYER